MNISDAYKELYIKAIHTNTNTIIIDPRLFCSSKNRVKTSHHNLNKVRLLRCCASAVFFICVCVCVDLCVYAMNVEKWTGLEVQVG